MPSFIEKLLHMFLKKVVVHGNGTIRCASGYEFPIGDGNGKAITVTFKSSAAQTRLVRDPELALGEIFMDGLLEIDGGDIFDLHMIVLTNMMAGKTAEKAVKPTFASRVLFGALQGTGKNTLKKSRKNVAHHYDLDRRLYDLFLGVDMQYSCAYFEHPSASLDDAQLAKKRHIASKLLLEEGQSVLDIGCGWGGMALYLTQVTGVTVRGVTLSKEQLNVAKNRATEMKVSEKVDFKLEDYRHVEDKFDRIVSVGMLEHVGAACLEEFFRKVGALLEPNGVALIHTIGRTDGPDASNPWIMKYIFPGGYIPALSELSRAIERAGLIITDLEVLRLHYAETLKEWRQRFNEKRDEVKDLYDDRFCRMWNFYLAVSEASFRAGQNVVFQIQLTKKVDAAPLTRDYMVKQETALRVKEGEIGV